MDNVLRFRKNLGVMMIEFKILDFNVIFSWDFRCLEEIVEEGDGYWVLMGSGKNILKIFVVKVSLVFIFSEYIE